LRSISLDENAYELLVEIIKNEFDKINKQNKVGPKQREKLKNLEEKLIKLQDLFIDGDLTKEEYQNHKKIIENLINEAKDRQIQFSKKKEVFDLYKNGL
jgi:DNA-binding MarR family transcriptional regulator